MSTVSMVSEVNNLITQMKGFVGELTNLNSKIIKTNIEMVTANSDLLKKMKHEYSIFDALLFIFMKTIFHYDVSLIIPTLSWTAHYIGRNFIACDTIHLVYQELDIFYLILAEYNYIRQTFYIFIYDALGYSHTERAMQEIDKILDLINKYKDIMDSNYISSLPGDLKRNIYILNNSQYLYETYKDAVDNKHSETAPRAPEADVMLVLFLIFPPQGGYSCHGFHWSLKEALENMNNTGIKISPIIGNEKSGFFVDHKNMYKGPKKFNKKIK